MATRRQMIDEALSLGRQELGFLSRGDVFKAEKLSKDRERILDEAMAGLDKESQTMIADRLVELKSLLDEITDAGYRLRSSLKRDLSNMKQQNRRIAGYSFGSGNMPRLARERFVSKKG
ncbi:hypothetical protein [Pseudodesulfovibrio piezophilus]|nr:hypothetical protein [Pseudodesulfovibrio piezophilus]